ncbi:MAG: hypothetical protein WCV67_05990 [Victivallaceae bacterium]
MLKLNASFSKKVPAEEEYSSKSYHASIECELPDGLSENQLKGKIHDTFELVRASVEAEIGSVQSNVSENGQTIGHLRYPQNKRGSDKKQAPARASARQLNYLLDLAHDKGVKPREIMERAGVDDLSDLNKAECSRLIDELSGKAKAA